MIEKYQQGKKVAYDELGRAYDPDAQRWAMRLALHNLGGNLIVAGALEAARQQGMKDMLHELDGMDFGWRDYDDGD